MFINYIFINILILNLNFQIQSSITLFIFFKKLELGLSKFISFLFTIYYDLSYLFSKSDLLNSSRLLSDNYIIEILSI
jgi:hypothetical protein